MFALVHQDLIIFASWDIGAKSAQKLVSSYINYFFLVFKKYKTLVRFLYVNESSMEYKRLSSEIKLVTSHKEINCMQFCPNY